MKQTQFIDVKREIRFKGPYTIEQVAKLVLTNRTDQRIAFKLQTLDPSRYFVRPGKGVLEPKQALSVTFKLRPIKQLADFKLAKQKFLLLAVSATDNTTVDNVEQLFQKALTGDIASTKIMAVFEDLNKPASSVGSTYSDSGKSLQSVISLPSHSKTESSQTSGAKEQLQDSKPLSAVITEVAKDDLAISKKDEKSCGINMLVGTFCAGAAISVALAAFFLYRRYNR